MRQIDAEQYIGLKWEYNDVQFEVIGYDNYLSSNKFKVKANNSVMYVSFRDINHLKVNNIYESYKKFYA